MADNIASITIENNVTFKLLEDGRTEICMIADKSFRYQQYALRDSLKEAGDKLTLKLSKFRKKRSLDANCYLWCLIGKLAEELKTSKEEIYRRYIKHYGLYRTIEISESAADTMIYVWNSHGLGWIAEKLDEGQKEGFILINLYYGSSCYNTKQMSRLIDAVIGDCKEQGIETLPPDEVKRLVEAWNGKS